MISEPMLLTDDVLYILDTLRTCGYRADVVGGAVRDWLLGRPSFDYDITTSASPDEVKAVFATHKTVDTGIKHGTVTLVIGGVGYEITTWRLDGEYLDSRHPESITFTKSLEEDLARRDFTVNAICYNPVDGYTDLYGGIEDLKAGVISAVGEPYRRFTEDALRIMRAVRFAAALGFSLDEKTKEAAIALKDTLSLVSEERIYVELKKLMSGENAYSALRDYGEIIKAVIPELSALKLPDAAGFGLAASSVRLLSLFMLNSDFPRKAFTTAMLRLKTDNSTRIMGERAIDTVIRHSLNAECDALLALSEYGVDAVRMALELGQLLGIYSSAEPKTLESAISSERPYSLSMLAIGGNELKELGITGKGIGDTLSELLDLCMKGECENTRDALLERARLVARCDRRA